MFTEWEGQSSLRFKGSKKIINPNTSSKVELPGLLGETSVGLERLKGKKHYEVTECQTVKTWKPCFKKAEKIEIPERLSGIKKIAAEYSKVKPRAERVHLEPKRAESDMPEYRIHMKTVFREAGRRIQDVETEEWDVHERFIGRKIKVEGLDAQRNGLEVRAFGDKCYKKPEHSSGFYKEGGLVTGSTIASRIPHQGKGAANNDFATVLSYEATNPRRTKWKDRERGLKEEEDNEAIRQLIEWEKTTLKEANPKLIDPDLSEGD